MGNLGIMGNVSNPAQNHGLRPVIVQFSSISAISRDPHKGEIEWNPIVRLSAGASGCCGNPWKVADGLNQQNQEVRSKNSPFCGLITPRAKRVCLECGKSLNAL